VNRSERALPGATEPSSGCSSAEPREVVMRCPPAVTRVIRSTAYETQAPEV
jgi:hypothetical protein